MLIYVHSSGRPHAQPTLTALVNAGLASQCRLVVQAKQVSAYKPIAAQLGVALAALPPRITTLSPTRQYILERARREGAAFCLMDDDLRFAARRTDDPTKFKDAIAADIRLMVYEIEATLAVGYAHVGICAREGGNRMLQDQVAARAMRVLAYNPKLFKAPVRFDRLPTKQDFDMTLQLLRQGLPNRVLHRWAHDQHGGSQAAGGCSVYRTPAMMEQSARALAKLHPGLVKVVTKTTKGAWGGGERVDVQIAWKKAYKEGLANAH